MPRQFHPSDLHTITTSDYDAMSPADQRAYWEFVLAQWLRTDDAFLDGDYERTGSIPNTAWGE